MVKKKILIVEDEESLLKLESILLTSKGYSVTGVADGVSALEQVVLIKPDLIVLDIMLPGMDGFEVCRIIKQNPETAHIPVMMLTAKKSSQDCERGMAAGASAYVTKPFKSAKIIEIIQELLSQ
ncbi:response regulator transcription factor [Geobacter benzoatilyticus]|jgi:twitching motility two-component system response regulator PilG|uniref:Response regulator n=1 Tax=Geobacter benzoatilyticus TaxID=2815309 RepID=A0ABX7Q294_9BACT|nr:response regulator [Geobacter benzoatilyticus]QSV45537.1 response regulator [Geobacter benzoatilyticus]